MRTCPFNGCYKDLPENIFACRKHWNALDYSERLKITDLYRAYRDHRIGIEELRREQQAVLGNRGTA